MLLLRKTLTFGFETTFTLENWWQSPGFCSECETPEKKELMFHFATALAKQLKLKVLPIKDDYGLDGFVCANEQGEAIFRFTPEPGSIEVNTPPVLIDGILSMITPLLHAAKEVGLVTYRSWWYGVKTGTGGGCHLNMGGFNEETNPWKNDFGLLLKYIAFYHNHPSLHYPFMGLDVGYGGNCMRMDEQSAEIEFEQNGTNGNDAINLPLSMVRFEEARKRYHEGWRPKDDELFQFFSETTLVKVKHSAPTLRKMRAPWYLLEDRAVEMLREPEEFLLLAELRIRILEQLQSESEIPSLKWFGSELHQKYLTYESLWAEFNGLCEKLEIDAEKYREFFERQFPCLEQGVSVPKRFYLREGRRERKILGADGMLGAVVLSKKIDSRYRRLELHAKDDLFQGYFLVNEKRYEASSSGIVFDIFVDLDTQPEQKRGLQIEFYDSHGVLKESSFFDVKSNFYVDAHEVCLKDILINQIN